MKEKKGFISTSVIYSFFLVFILLMLTMLLSLTNKKLLIKKINDGGDTKPDIICSTGDNLGECLLKHESVDKSYGLTDSYAIKSKISEQDKPNFSATATIDEGMYAATDDYGTSYYYRGAVEDNYIVFANYVWRVVRINGNDSIRMIYQGDYNPAGTNSKVSGETHILSNAIHFNLSNWAQGSANSKCYLKDKFAGCLTNYNWFTCGCGRITIAKRDACLQAKYEKYSSECDAAASEGNGAYLVHNIGYMNSDTASSFYSYQFQNEKSSQLKESLEGWFLDQAIPSNYLSDTIFCGDKNKIKKDNKTAFTCSSVSGTTPFTNWFKKELCGVSNADKYLYEGITRIINFDGDKPLKANPTLVCPDTGEAANDEKYRVANLSRYSVDSTTYQYIYKKDSNVYCVKPPYGAKYELFDDFGDCKQVGINDDNIAKYGNGELNYPIGAITADEVAMAGGVYGKNNTNYYLYSGSKYWTITLSHSDYASGFIDKTLNMIDGNDLDKLGSYYFSVNENGQIIMTNDKKLPENGGTAYVRPVVNLKQDIIYCSGEGTAKDPFIISNGSCS